MVSKINSCAHQKAGVESSTNTAHLKFICSSFFFNSSYEHRRNLVSSSKHYVARCCLKLILCVAVVQIRINNKQTLFNEQLENSPP